MSCVPQTGQCPVLGRRAAEQNSDRSKLGMEGQDRARDNGDEEIVQSRLDLLQVSLLASVITTVIHPIVSAVPLAFIVAVDFLFLPPVFWVPPGTPVPGTDASGGQQCWPPLASFGTWLFWLFPSLQRPCER